MLLLTNHLRTKNQFLLLIKKCLTSSKNVRRFTTNWYFLGHVRSKTVLIKNKDISGFQDTLRSLEYRKGILQIIFEKHVANQSLWILCEKKRKKHIGKIWLYKPVTDLSSILEIYRRVLAFLSWEKNASLEKGCIKNIWFLYVIFCIYNEK